MPLPAYQHSESQRLTHLPSQERGLLNDCRLDNLLSGKHTPRHGVDGIFCRIRPKFTLLVARIHAYQVIASGKQLALDLLDLVGWDKELDKCLLEDVAPSRSPSDHWVFARCRVDSWLTTDCPVLLVGRVESFEVGKNRGGFRG